MLSESANATKELAQAAPPIIVTTTSFLGIALQEWVYVLTGIYTLFQIIRLLPKMYGCVVCFYKYGTCKRTCKG